QYDWLADTDEEVDEQELEAHYSYMAKIQELPTADSGTDSEPVEQDLISRLIALIPWSANIRFVDLLEVFCNKSQILLHILVPLSLFRIIVLFRRCLEWRCNGFGYLFAFVSGSRVRSGWN
nr:hypothetical protein [Tanacetum cinerariifolium]